MPVDSASDLVQALRNNRVLAPAQLDEVAPLQRRFPEAKALARALIDRQWLTPYQGNLLLQGAADKLALGPYVILERLGDNALGQVFRARHQLMNRVVSLTVVREELLSQPRAVEQFYQEIQANSQLSEAHIVHAYDAGPIGRTHFFAAEHVEGIDLDKLVQQSGRLPVATAISFIKQAALGLQHAHERGILHHDLRPANLLVARVAGQNHSVSVAAKTPLPTQTQLKEATIKISNLGLTLLQPRLRNADRSDAAMDYVAPEQVQGGAPDIRSSLYSLGAIFYYLLAARTPFAAESGVRRRKQPLDAPKPLETYRPDVPASIRAIIHTLLASNPHDRYASPAEFLSALTGENGSRLTHGAGAARPGAHGAARPARGRAGRYLLAVGLFLMLTLLGGLSVWLLRPASDTVAAKPAGDRVQPNANSLAAAPVFRYVKKPTMEESIQATLQASGLPTFAGTWYTIAPFENKDRQGFNAVYPPETEIDLRAVYPGKDGQRAGWKAWANFQPGVVHDLKPRSARDGWSVMYLMHEMEVSQAGAVDVSLGSDDTITVWLNGKKVLANEAYRGCTPDQDWLTLNLQPGRNQLLVKICNGEGDWRFYIRAAWPAALIARCDNDLRRDFAGASTPGLQYLSDLADAGSQVGHGAFGKQGSLGYGAARIVVNGQPSPKGLSTHPAGTSTAHVAYALNKRYASFKATVAINDTGNKNGGGSVVFTVVGDGKELWKSRSLSRAGETEDCAVNIKDIHRLELRATCPEANNSSHAVWLEPYVAR